ncbi:MAG: hypothetical protein OEX14_00140, partial [Paracoccaceae bacterium]|nr:hypothetical protein [Paracoccaceae bacterium]
MAKTREPFTAALEDGVDSLTQFDADDDMPVTEGATGGVEPDWLSIAKSSYEDSTQFIDTSLRARWESNERAFQGRHPSGSKYHSDTYKHRSKLFRPKTRTTIRQGEAAAAASFFSNEDVISVNPLDDNNVEAKASAAINKELLQYRLTTPNQRIGIPWFLTCVGAYQESEKYGVVCSKQWWEYRERKEKVEVPLIDPVSGQPVIDAATGQPIMTIQEKTVIERDRPRIDLIPLENIRIDRGADWRDPINTSPYVIIKHPMYVHEVEERMSAPDPKTGQPPWKRLAAGDLKAAAGDNELDSTRSFREDGRQDSRDSETAIDEYSIVWVHENIVRWNGRDWVYYTAGTRAMLSDPVLLEEVYLHAKDGDRPLVMGYCVLEAHKTYPSGKPQLVEGLQQEANELVNLRLDNVKLALNKRYKVKRGRQVDLRSLLRNAPGSVTLVNEMDDVDVIETRDVTSSAYAEQDRINVDFDDIIGAFTPGSVQTNRQMNETVGGMEMLSGAANLLGELDLRVFAETWVEPVLRQALKMEQAYETDTTLLALAGQNANIYQRFGINEITDGLLSQDLTVRVNVGIGATDPKQRLMKFRVATETLGSIMGPGMVQQLNMDEVIKEVFGALGYRDGSRFFKKDGPDPIVEQLTAQLEQLQRKLETREIDVDGKIEVARIGAMAKLAIENMSNEGSVTQEGLRLMHALQLEHTRAQNQMALDRQHNDDSLRNDVVGRTMDANTRAAE